MAKLTIEEGTPVFYDSVEPDDQIRVRLDIPQTKLGEFDEAFAWLEHAYERRESLADLAVDPGWDPLRSDPRFDELLVRVGLPVPES